MPKRQLKGKVTSVKMKDTIVVETERVIAHPKYKRRYKKHKKYKAHVKDEGYNIGDIVIIEECSPISKDKNFKVIKKVKSVGILKEEVTEETQ